MGIFNRKPRVKALARAGDVDGLIAASRFQQLSSTAEGEVQDLGLRTRVAAIYALGELDWDRGHEAVVGGLTDPEDRVRTASIVVLFEHRAPEPIADGLRWLPREGNSRTLAVRALLELRKPGSSRQVADALVHQHADEPVAEEEMAALEDLLADGEDAAAKAEVVGLLAAAMRDEDEFVANRAVQLLVRLAPASVDALIEALPDPRAGHHAAVGLAEIKDARALQPLIEALDHSDSRARAAACAALGELRDSSAVEPLLRATQDPELTVRTRAGAALDQLGTVAVVIGISALLRPMIDGELEAGAEVAPELESGKVENESSFTRQSANATTLERVARLLEGLGTAGQSGVY
jgi:HEAT repeat protein